MMELILAQQLSKLLDGYEFLLQHDRTADPSHLLTMLIVDARGLIRDKANTGPHPRNDTIIVCGCAVCRSGAIKKTVDIP